MQKNTGILEDEKEKEIKNVNQHTFHVKRKKERNISSQEPESKKYKIKRYNVYALDLILKIEIYI